MIIQNFKRQFSFQNRIEESSRVLTKYPDRKPIICEKLSNQRDLPDIDKKKYLVPNELTVGQFLYIIRQRLHLRSEEAIFLFINNKIVSSSANIEQIYYQEREPDGFLYVKYSKENIFGS